ncbi:MAG: flagellar export protein FliJ [Pseudohongiellaceae bacterium]
MKRTPLDTLIELARETRNRAGQLLAGEQHNQQQLAEQLTLLRRYRGEYAGRLQETMEQGIDLASLQDYQRFLQSLDTAIARAQDRVLTQEGKVMQCRERWQKAQYRLCSFDTLAVRGQDRERQHAQRKERREHDEISNNLYRRERQNLYSRDSGPQEAL